jgi:hypothetical protein
MFICKESHYLSYMPAATGARTIHVLSHPHKMDSTRIVIHTPSCYLHDIALPPQALHVSSSLPAVLQKCSQVSKTKFRPKCT